MAKYNHTVRAEEVGLSVNQIIRANYRFSARFRTKMKFGALIDLNGDPTPGFVKPACGDVISIRLPEEQSKFPPEDIPITPLYEDEDLLLLDKQPGIIVHPTKGHPLHTIANGLMKYMADRGETYKIRFANRVDMDTSGIVIVAKNANVQNDISHQMRSRKVVKKYLAVVRGSLAEDHLIVDAPIGRPTEDSVARAVMEEGGKDAVTEIDVRERFPDATLVEVTLHTGRTHQIRVHLSHLGHPILGDHLYGGDAPSLIDRQALHAHTVSFTHPISGEPLTVTAPLPEDIARCLTRLRTR